MISRPHDYESCGLVIVIICYYFIYDVVVFTNPGEVDVINN